MLEGYSLLLPARLRNISLIFSREIISKPYIIWKRV